MSQSNQVYVGRIPFDLTEEQLEDIFRTAGPIQQTRLMFDKMTGKSKGFAFIQYYDPKSASSAIRNLDNYKVGNMRLKVNYSSGGFQSKNNNQNNNANTEHEQESAGAIPDIVNAVSSLTPQYKLELLTELRQLVKDKPEEASLLLSKNPQLAYAIVQSLFELGMIDTSKAGSLILNEFAEPTNPLPPKPVQNSRPNVQANVQRGSRVRTPLPQAQTQPHVQSAAQSQPQSNPASDMYKQIMQLTPQHLAQMTPEQRQAAIDIQNKIRSGEISI